MALSVIILAAGQGTRMKSRLPKVLHPLAGRPMLEHVYAATKRFSATEVHIVYGHGGERVREALGHLKARWVEQARQLGTGHAVMQAMPSVKPASTALILYGDVPLITHSTLQRLVDAAGRRDLALLTVRLENPTGYGRIVRDSHGDVQRIVEQKDASESEQAIHEVNTGMMAVSAKLLRGWVDRLSNKNAQKEYYLTDVIEMAVADKVRINTVSPESPFEVMGVNDRAQLAELERHYQFEQAQHLMRQGVTLRDPSRFDLRGELEVGQDVSIDVNVVIEGRVKLGNRVSVGPNNVLRDVSIGDDVTILANCVIEDAAVGDGARLGPFARIRPETVLGADVHVGNFVEVKKSVVARGSKLNHLSYIGDADIGSNTNIGAGTITCNYDGANKHKTIIGDDVFIGSDCQLVAPVRVGDGATLGAGTTLAKDAPAGKLTISRVRQQVVDNWQRPRKKK
ncbi:MAG: bifunctional UDP-N-acetylglucosamine diphosphorylase/glucosamine-1-phosphate N-acetyltransferase GlmU [Gammaproteobacteria bacterium]